MPQPLSVISIVKRFPPLFFRIGLEPQTGILFVATCDALISRFDNHLFERPGVHQDRRLVRPDIDLKGSDVLWISCLQMETAFRSDRRDRRHFHIAGSLSSKKPAKFGDGFLDALRTVLDIRQKLQDVLLECITDIPLISKRPCLPPAPERSKHGAKIISSESAH